MSTTDSHLELIRRWLRGEVVNGHVGVRMHGGPWDKETKIVQLDDQGKPPEDCVHGVAAGVGISTC